MGTLAINLKSNVFLDLQKSERNSVLALTYYRDLFLSEKCS